MKAARETVQVWHLFACIAIASTALSLVTLHSAEPGWALPTVGFCGLNSTCVQLNNTFTCAADGRQVNGSLNCSDSCEVGQTDGVQCATFNSNLCLRVVCKGGECNLPEQYVPPSCNDHNSCTIDSCDECANDCTGMCVHQPILNGTACNLAPGEPCSVGLQCASTFCVDGVCCNSACNATQQSCNLPGSVGQCATPAALAPVVSGRGVLVIGVLLFAIGLLSLRRAMLRPRP